jgi:hypothetical protein
MATLSEIRHSIKQGNRQQAAAQLQDVLRTRPSADAWFLAAQMTGDRDKAIRYLRYALQLDAGHVRARRALASFGVHQTAAETGFWSQLRRELESFGQDSRLLGWMDPTLRMVTVLVVMVGTLAVSLILLVNLLTPDTMPPLPDPRPAVQVTSTALIDHFYASSLRITSLAPLTLMETVPVREAFSMVVEDGGQLFAIQFYFYDSLMDLFDDHDRLLARYDDRQLGVHHTVVMVYPEELAAPTARMLEDTLYSISQ